MGMTATLDSLIDRLERELKTLIESGNNWQITLHGGRCGHVKLETLIVDEMTLDPKAPQAKHHR